MKWKIKAIVGISEFKLITYVEHDGEFIRNLNEIADNLVTGCNQVSSSDVYPYNFHARKAKIEHDRDFQLKSMGHITCLSQ